MKTKRLCLGVVLMCSLGNTPTCALTDCHEVLATKQRLQDEHFARGLIGAITESEESDYQAAMNLINLDADGCERWAQ